MHNAEVLAKFEYQMAKYDGGLGAGGVRRKLQKLNLCLEILRSIDRERTDFTAEFEFLTIFKICMSKAPLRTCLSPTHTLAQSVTGVPICIYRFYFKSRLPILKNC